MELHGKVAVVTGASSGIGAASVRALTRAGMTVVASARRTDRLEAMAAADPQVHARALDVRDDESVAALAKRVDDELGACHVLVNNAGINAGQSFRGPEDVDEIADVMDVNFLGQVRCMAAFADLLRRSAPARVINVASVAGKVGAGTGGYGASKFALVGLSEHIHGHWARQGVAVCQLNPGYVRTEGFPQTQLRRSPLRRLVAEPEQVADAVAQVARTGQAERTVPRWYRAATTVRHVAPPMWRAIARRL